MKKDMVNLLMELFDSFDPSFQKVFEAEYPKLNGEQQVLFLKYLNLEMDKLTALLDKLAREAEPVAA